MLLSLYVDIRGRWSCVSARSGGAFVFLYRVVYGRVCDSALAGAWIYFRAVHDALVFRRHQLVWRLLGDVAIGSLRHRGLT